MEKFEFVSYVIAATVIIGLFSFFVIKYIVNKSLDGIENNSKKINDLDKAHSLLSAKVQGNEEDITELYQAWKISNEGVSRLTSTIATFDNNMKIYHSEMKALVSDNTKAMSEVALHLKNK